MTEEIRSSPEKGPESENGMDLQMMTEYLLGELPSVEREQLEELLFSDPAIYHRLMIAEDRLIDDYLCRQLSHKQQIRFEQYFLISDRRRAKLAMGQLLQTTISDFNEPRESLVDSLWRMPKGLRRIFAVALLVISFIFIAAYLIIWR
jgi:CRP-like cAMP-binding protein